MRETDAQIDKTAGIHLLSVTQLERRSHCEWVAWCGVSRVCRISSRIYYTLVTVVDGIELQAKKARHKRKRPNRFLRVSAGRRRL